MGYYVGQFRGNYFSVLDTQKLEVEKVYSETVFTAGDIFINFFGRYYF